MSRSRRQTTSAKLNRADPSRLPKILGIAAVLGLCGCTNEVVSNPSGPGARGEACDQNSDCQSPLVCTASGVCGDATSDPCATVSCGEHGSCASDGGQPSCVCDDGYHAVDATCHPDVADVKLTWAAPPTYEDGTTLPFDNLAGFVLRYGTESGVYTTTDDLGLPACEMGDEYMECQHTVSDLPSGNWYFAVSAYDVEGTESALSSEASKLIP